MASSQDANVNQGNQANNDFPTNVLPNVVIVGDITPYQLRDDQSVEEPFEPITCFAISESGQAGPLNEDQLKEFLQRLDKRNKRNRRITTVAQEYIQDPMDILRQLVQIRNRIYEIETNEDHWTEFLKTRIGELIKAIEERKSISQIAEVPLSHIAKRTLVKVANRDPRIAEELLNFIKSGINTGNLGPEGSLLDKMYRLNTVMYFQEKVKKLHFKYVCGMLEKAISNLISESMLV